MIGPSSSAISPIDDVWHSPDGGGFFDGFSSDSWGYAKDLVNLKSKGEE